MRFFIKLRMPIVLALTSVFVVFGCGDSGLGGEYPLTEANGEDVPVILTTEGSYTRQVVSGKLTLDETSPLRGTFTMETVFNHSDDSGLNEPEVETSFGSWEAQEATGSDDVDFRIFLDSAAGGTLSLSRSGNRYYNTAPWTYQGTDPRDGSTWEERLLVQFGE